MTKPIPGNVPVPVALRHLDRDARGYPIPYIVMRGRDGRPYFTINDHVKVQRCFTNSLCGITGRTIIPSAPDLSSTTSFTRSGFWFVGGPLSFHPKMGAFLDPPMCYDAAEYALRVCPYLAVRNYNSSMADTQAKQASDSKNLPAGTTVIDAAKKHPITGAPPAATANRRPDVFLLGRANDVAGFEASPGHLMFKPIELTHTFMWRHGEPLPRNAENDELLAETIRKGWEQARAQADADSEESDG